MALGVISNWSPKTRRDVAGCSLVEAFGIHPAAFVDDLPGGAPFRICGCACSWASIPSMLASKAMTPRPAPAIRRDSASRPARSSGSTGVSSMLQPRQVGLTATSGRAARRRPRCRRAGPTGKTRCGARKRGERGAKQRILAERAVDDDVAARADCVERLVDHQRAIERAKRRSARRRSAAAGRRSCRGRRCPASGRLNW